MEPNKETYNNQETQELIDSYLLGRLDTDDLAEFKERMSIYPDFRVAIEKLKAVMRGTEEQGLKNSLEDFHSEIVIEPEKKWLTPGWLALAASVLILIGVSTWAILISGSSSDKVFAENFKPDPGLPTTMGTASDYEFYYGMVSYKRKEYGDAILRWEPLYAANPENDTVVYFLGVANLANSNPRQATKYLEMAQTKTESVFYEDIQYYLALSLLKENRIEEAIETLENSDSQKNKALLEAFGSL